MARNESDNKDTSAKTDQEVGGSQPAKGISSSQSSNKADDKYIELEVEPTPVQPIPTFWEWLRQNYPSVFSSLAHGTPSSSGTVLRIKELEEEIYRLRNG